MYSHAVIDLHCDTLTALMGDDSYAEVLAALRDSSRRADAVSALERCARGRDTLNDPCHQLALCKLPKGVHWAQCCAIFIPDELKGEGAIAYYRFFQQQFVRQMGRFSACVLPCRCADDIRRAWDCGKTAAILTVENGSALAGQLERVEQLARDGVRMMTLTWNGENEIGSGHVTGHGLSDFGRRVIPELETQGILVDVSHLNDAGFADLLTVAQKPFVASHSNARAVCGHRRNLTDGQIRAMVERRCLIGLNYYNLFLRDDGRPATLDDLYRHVEHFLELGAEDCLALGSDFDGADLPPCLDNPEKAAGIYGYLTGRGLSPALAEKIMWRNALAFFQRNL